MSDVSTARPLTADDNSYSIDELASESGIPSRTIRFYQAKGVLDPPTRSGRVAVYDEAHLSRLRLVAELQDKGLRLRAIRDLLKREQFDNDSIQEWLGVGEHIGSWAEEASELMDEAQLKEFLGNPKPGMIARLARTGGLEIQGEGKHARYLVKSPALLKIGMRLEEAGIDLETAITMHDILEKRLGQAADEVVKYAMGRLGEGFAESDSPADVQRALEALFPGAAGGDAVRIVFTQQIDRAVGEALKKGLPKRSRRAQRRANRGR